MDRARGEIAAFPIRVEQPEVRAALEALLAGLGLPFRPAAKGVEVPADLVGSLLPLLIQRFELHGDEHEVEVTGLVKAPEPPDPRLLELTREEWSLLGEAGQDQLLDLLERGGQDLGGQALRKAGEWLDRDGVQSLLLRAVASGFRSAVFTLCRLLGPDGGYSPSEDLGLRALELISELSDENIPLALHIVGQHPNLDLVRNVLPLLEHPEEAVRDEADEVLCCTTGEDMGFEAAAAESERAMAVARWRDWVEKLPGHS